MRFKPAIAAIAAALLFTGCGGATIGLRSTNSPAFGAGALPPGGSYTQGSVAVQADVSAGAFFGAMFLAYLMSGMHEGYRGWSEGAALRKPPEMAEDRSVVERDCSQPLGPMFANLRCK